MPKVRNYEMMDMNNYPKWQMLCFMKEERQGMMPALPVYLIISRLIWDISVRDRRQGGQTRQPLTPSRFPTSSTYRQWVSIQTNGDVLLSCKSGQWLDVKD